MKLAEEDIWPVALTYWNMAPDELRDWSETDEGSIGPRLVALCREYYKIDSPKYREFGSHCP